MSFLKDFWAFLSTRKKYWLLPILRSLDAGARSAFGVCARKCDRPIHLHLVLAPPTHERSWEFPRCITIAPPLWWWTVGIVAAAQEERFSRKKHDSGFPRRSHRLLSGTGLREPVRSRFRSLLRPSRCLKFERLLETYLMFAPSGLHLLPDGHAAVDSRKTLPEKFSSQ